MVYGPFGFQGFVEGGRGEQDVRRRNTISTFDRRHRRLRLDGFVPSLARASEPLPRDKPPRSLSGYFPLPRFTSRFRRVPPLELTRVPVSLSSSLFFQVVTDRFALTNGSTPSCESWIKNFCGGSWLGISASVLSSLFILDVDFVALFKS